MARFRDPRIQTLSGSTDEGTWDIIGGTFDPDTGIQNAGDQPQFTGDPLFSGHYTVVGNICHFGIDVDMDNIDDFGTGQYFMMLPFQSHHNIIVSDGCLHDESTGNQYAILGHIVEGSDKMDLFSISSNGRQVPFSDSLSSPINLDELDNFHISGTYEISPL